MEFKIIQEDGGKLKIRFIETGKEVTLGWIDSKDPSIINMSRIRHIHFHRNLEAYGFNYKFLKSCEQGGIKYIRFKLDIKENQKRYVHLLPIEDIIERGIASRFNNFEQQLFFKEAWLLEYLEYETEKT